MSKTSIAAKTNTSSYQVLKTLKVLLEDNYSMIELIEKLNKDEIEPKFNNSVVSKYINTCRYCGIEIPKIHNKYFVANLPFGMDITIDELHLIEKLHYYAKEKLTKNPIKIFDRFLNKLNRFTNKHIIRVEKKTEHLTYEIFDKAISEKRKIILMLRAKASLECIPIKMKEDKGKIFFEVKYKDKNKSISADRVSGIEILKKNFREDDGKEQVVLYKLYGDLAKRYNIRENEQITQYNLPEYIIVKNIGENKDELISRLLRYENLCQIISPGHYKEEMKNTIKNMLKNYGEI